jgi:hypothetical protein
MNERCTLPGIPFLKTSKPEHMTTLMWFGGATRKQNFNHLHNEKQKMKQHINITMR